MSEADCACVPCFDAYCDKHEPDIAPEPPLLGPPLVWRDIVCPGCRRLFCKALAPAGVKVIPHCEGCEREGR